MLTGRHFAIPALCAGLWLCCPELRGEKAGKAAAPSPTPVPALPPMNAEQRQGALFLDALSVPSPGEVFAAMNKACRPNWATLVGTATSPSTTDRSQLALAVGVLTANGYIAVEAQDGQQVKNVGREIMAIAKALGVSQSLLGRGHSLMEFADSGAWDALADELEATENEVKETMVEQKDKDLVSLTSAAAWLRGLEVASGVVLAGEGLQGASVLRQPELARTLASRLGTLPERMKREGLATSVETTLSSIAVLLEKTPFDGSPKESGKIRENLTRIHDEAAAVVKEIMTSTTARPSPTPAADPMASPSQGSSATPAASGSSNIPSRP